MKTLLSRRTVLRGALAGTTLSVSLPRLDAMLDTNGTAWAAGGAPLPKRFGVWAWSNGVQLARWVPKTTGTGWDTPDILTPLSLLRDYASIVTGMETKYGVGKGHLQCNTNLMTGMPTGRMANGKQTAAGPSIDQIVAKAIGGATPFKSIEVGVDNGMPHEIDTAARYFSHNGPSSPNVPIYSCRELFDRLFAKPVPGAMPSAEATALAAARAQLKQRVVDLVRADAAALSKRLGARDKARLAQHLEGIDAIERRLTMLPTGGGACAAPAAPDAKLVNSPQPNLQGAAAGDADSTKIALEGMSLVINKTMAELLALALSCDLSRVFTFQYSPPGTRAMIPSLMVGDYHGLTHDERVVGGVQSKCLQVAKYYMGELDVLMKTFKATPDGAGNLLDNCAILATTDVAEGTTHSPSDFPMLLIGRGGGTLKPGVHYRSTTAEAATKVPLTLARAAGAALPSFGVDLQLVSDSVGAVMA